MDTWMNEFVEVIRVFVAESEGKRMRSKEREFLGSGWELCRWLGDVMQRVGISILGPFSTLGKIMKVKNKGALLSTDTLGWVILLGKKVGGRKNRHRFCWFDTKTVLGKWTVLAPCNDGSFQEMSLVNLSRSYVVVWR